MNILQMVVSLATRSQKKYLTISFGIILLLTLAIKKNDLATNYLVLSLTKAYLRYLNVCMITVILKEYVSE